MQTPAKPSFVFTSGHADPLRHDLGDRRFWPITGRQTASLLARPEPAAGAATHQQQLIGALEWALRRIRVSIAYADEGEYFQRAEDILAAAKASRGCPTCSGTGIHRPPHAREPVPCTDCTPASATR